MPFWSLSKKSLSNSEVPLSSKERKTLLGLKAVQAQQNPEPVYDLSSCGSSCLPDDTYTFCKLMGKTDLNISGNCLTSIDSGGALKNLAHIEVINASDNKIDKLPSQISLLKKLKVLELSQNKLKTLPESLQSLSNLRELHLSNNRLTRVPPSICALPRLQLLNLKGNEISILPNELCGLQCSLISLEFDYEKIENIPQDILSSDLKNIMKHLCKLKGVAYTGPTDSVDINDGPNIEENLSSSPAVDNIMIEYMRKKQGLLQAQICAEELYRVQEKEQLTSILQTSNKYKEKLLSELSESSDNMTNYNERRQEKLNERIKLEETFRMDQEEELEAYLNNTADKEALLMNISAQDENLQQEVEAIVAAREREKSKLLADLTSSEQMTNAVLQELVHANQNTKSSEFMTLLKQQEEEMHKLLFAIVETSTELRKSDVIKVMQNDLMREMMTEMQRQKVEEKHKSWVTSVVHEGMLEEAHLQDMMQSKTVDQNNLITNLLQEEQYQAEAFKLLLLKLDLKRNNVIRQIAQVENELSRLSSLEVRKKRCGVQYGSTTMLNQRKTLVGLLKSLISAKDDRDNELNQWVSNLSSHHKSDKNSDDFWLLHYQRLMAMKPAALAEAEQHVDAEVQKVLNMAHALDLLPIFASHNITYSQLLDMSEEDFASIGMGSATYQSIQRALNSYLNACKVGHNEPSAPPSEDFPSAPPEEDVCSPVSEGASAPPVESAFLEAECVVCLSNNPCVIFLPCGHVCTCTKCCGPLVTCPLCRTEITNRCFIQSY